MFTGAAPEPYVTSIKETKDWTQLQCSVRGAFPEPSLKWLNSSGNILHAENSQITEKGGRYDVILKTTVTKTDTYSCVATQQKINHQTEADIDVYIGGKLLFCSIFILADQF